MSGRGKSSLWRVLMDGPLGLCPQGAVVFFWKGLVVWVAGWTEVLSDDGLARGRIAGGDRSVCVLGVYGS
jgi:hypothetical protein